MIVFSILIHPELQAEADKEFKDNLFTDHRDKSFSITGRFRNDAIITDKNQKGSFSDILENKIVLQKAADDWNFYADGRLYLYTGEAASIRNPPRHYDAELLRGFVRYFSDLGNWTLGKTYINQGVQGPLNIFETDKKLNLSDTVYAKAGFLALEYQAPLGDVSGLQVYGGSHRLIHPVTEEVKYSYAGGFSLYSNAADFDYGLAANRIDSDRNISGIYFKGDLFLGVQGSYGAHFTDRGKYQFSEANAGLDYSFFNGNIIFSSMVYYNEKGAAETTTDQPRYDAYFSTKLYSFSQAAYRYDEFLSFAFASLVNLIDYSLVLIPSVTGILSDGLSLNLNLLF